MSEIKPFRALRPRPDLVEQIASPPYDVLDSAEARAMADGNPHSFLHVTKPEIDLDPGVNLYDDSVYATGAANFRRMVDEGWLVQEAAPALYVYQQDWNGHVQAGIVAGASVEEYENDRIKKHEFTRPDKEDDRTRHVDTVNINAGPVFLTYEARADIDALVNEVRAGKPLYDFTAADGIRHTVWTILDPARIQQLVAMFAEIPATYVADGHHRSASAARVGKQRRDANPSHTGQEVYNHFLAVFFPHDQLKILDYNRVILEWCDADPDELIAEIEERFTVSESAVPAPDRPKMFGMYFRGVWYDLVAKPGTFPEDDPVRSLDVAILQDNVIGPLFGIDDPRTDKRIDFVGGIRGTAELERRVNAGGAVAFALHPTSIDQLMRVADSGEVMPPKSTWFEPKLRSGLLVRSLAEE